ncbi:hypothetical protein OIU78_011843 [Salix suchowensis]|nr:hypothetical protein OIU78_011843 [Salix suchowensis]
MKGSKICRYKNYRSFVLGIRTGFSPACLEFGLSGSLSFLFLNEEGKKSSAADQRMAIELAARNECSAEAGKLAARYV